MAIYPLRKQGYKPEGSNSKLPPIAMWQVKQNVTTSRAGKKVTVRGHDGTETHSDTVEANLLYEILGELKKGKK